MAPDDEEPLALNDDDDLDDTYDTDMDGDEDRTAAGYQPPSSAPPPITDLGIEPQNRIPNPYPPSDPVPAPQNGAFQVIPLSSTAAVPGDLQTPDVKLPRIEERRPIPSPPLDESRRLFQRLWTDDDEIKILTRFLEFTSSRGTTFASHQYDTGPFYEQIKNELQLDFNKNQLIEKLRRLKRKYRNTATRMANHGQDFTFRSPHEKATYDIAKKIWSASIKRSRESDNDDDLNPYANNTSNAGKSSDRKITASRSRRHRGKRAMESSPATPMVPVMSELPALPPPVMPGTPSPVSSEGVVKVEVQSVLITTPVTAMPIQKPSNSTVAAVSAPSIPSVIEETVKSCLSPIFKELLNTVVSSPPGLELNFLPLLNFGGNLGNLGNLATDEKWKKQQILELEVYLKRVELIREQIELTMEELKASPVSGS